MMRMAVAAACSVLILSLYGGGVISGQEIEPQLDDNHEIVSQRSGDGKETPWDGSIPTPILKSKKTRLPSFPPFFDSDLTDVYYEPKVIPSITANTMIVPRPIIIVPNCFDHVSYVDHSRRVPVSVVDAENDGSVNKQYGNLRVTTVEVKEPLNDDQQFYLDVYIDKANSNDIFKDNPLYTTENLQSMFLECMNIHQDVLNLQSKKKEIGPIFKLIPEIIEEITTKCKAIENILLKENFKINYFRYSNGASNQKETWNDTKHVQSSPPIVNNSENIEFSTTDKTALLHESNINNRNAINDTTVSGARLSPDYNRHKIKKNKKHNINKTPTAGIVFRKIMPQRDRDFHFTTPSIKEGKRIMDGDTSIKMKPVKKLDVRSDMEENDNVQETSEITENLPNQKNYVENKILSIETRELMNGSVITELKDVNTRRAEYPNPILNNTNLYPILSGQIMLKQNDEDEIPLYFTQNNDGKLIINIDGAYLCKHLMNNSNKSRIIKAICQSNKN